MQPEKARKTKVREKKVRKSIHGILHGTAFLLSFFVIGPLVHEIAHIGVLEILSCTHREVFKTSIYGIYGTVEPLCQIDVVEQGFFYLSGYSSTLLSGTVLTLFSVEEKDGYFKTHDYLASAGSGILLSMIIPLTLHGDLRTFASVAGLPESIGIMASLIVLLTASALGLRELEISFDVSER